MRFPDFYTCLRVCFPLNPNHGTFQPSKEKKNHINLGPLSIQGSTKLFTLVVVLSMFVLTAFIGY